MKIFKKILTGLLTLLLTGLIAILIVSFTIKDVLIEDILFDSLKSVIMNKNYEESSTTSDELPDDGIITNNEIVNEILESKEVKELVNKYIDKVIDTLGDDEISINAIEDLNIEQNMIDYIKENKNVIEEKTGIEITDDMINKANEKLDSIDAKKVIKQSIENTRNNLTPAEKQLLRAYQFIISAELKKYLIIGIIIDILLIGLLEMSFYKWIKNLAGSMIVGSLCTIATSLSLSIILNNMLGVAIKTNKMIDLSVIILITGILISILFSIINKYLKSKKGDRNEVSKVLN